MSDLKFDKFVSSHQKDKVSNREERVKGWLQDLNDLYDQIKGFVRDYVDRKQIILTSHDVTINEEQLGIYKAKELLLQIGSNAITITPIGCNVIGARGRVDLSGPAGKARLVLVDKDASRPIVKITETPENDDKGPATNALTEPSGLAWKIATPPPTISYIELNQENFFQAVMEVSNG